jgi:GLPGLI family protein
MKNILLIISCCFAFSQLKAQTIEAHYSVKSPRQIPLSDDKTKEIIIEWEGTIYQSGAKTISYLVPQYLNQYPTGIMNFPTPDGNSIAYSLSTDTMQMPELYNIDSLRLWRCNNMFSTGQRQYSTRKFGNGEVKWKLLPETKIINGLQCQHAQVMSGSGTTIVHDVWYYPQVALQYGFLLLRDAPGLIVECSSPLANISYSLKYFKTAEPIDNAVFWPALFNKTKFEEMYPVKKPMNDAKKSAIMNEQ